MSAKADFSVTRSELKEAHEMNSDTSHSAAVLEDEIKVLKQKHETEITAMQREHEEKVISVTVESLLIVWYKLQIV